MGATADTIWQVPAYLPYLQPTLTDVAVATAEEKIGFKLPKEYLDLLNKQNGGYIRYRLPNMVHDKIAGIGPNFPSLTDFDWEDAQEHVNFPLAGLVPFDGDGHWHLCFDYRQNSAVPVITHADIECNAEARIANSFAEYLQLLRVPADKEYVLETLTSIEEVTAQLASSLRTTIGPPDSWAHGYPTYRLALGTKAEPEWLWISANLAPRGFVRAEDRNYAQLKDLLPGTAARFPEAPATSYLLSMTGAHAKVRDACAKAGFVLRPLREYLSES